MNISFILAYAKRCRHELQAVHKNEGILMVSLWLDSVWAFIRYGCTIRQYVDGGFYKYSSFERKKIITCRKFYKILRMMNKTDDVKFLEHKDLFNVRFHPFVHRKWLAAKDMEMQAFADMCLPLQGLIVKPLGGTEGHGIYAIDSSDLASLKQIEQQFDALKGKNVIIEQLIHQHPRMVFNNHSVNTLRVITVMRRNSNVVTVVKAVLRAGVGNSVVDNYHQGGCCYEVDLKSGRVCSLGVSTQTKQVMFHPGTDVCILGYEIPNWKQVLDGVRDAHLILPQCRYISWDVAVTESGVELIEGNHNGDYDMLEFVGSNKYWPLMKQFL